METFNTSFESTQNKQHEGTRITGTEVRGKGVGGGVCYDFFKNMIFLVPIFSPSLIKAENDLGYSMREIHCLVY